MPGLDAIIVNEGEVAFSNLVGAMLSDPINFNKNPILNLSNVPLKNLSINSKRDIHKLMNTLFWEGSPDVLIDIISNSK